MKSPVEAPDEATGSQASRPGGSALASTGVRHCQSSDYFSEYSPACLYRS